MAYSPYSSSLHYFYFVGPIPNKQTINAAFFAESGVFNVIWSGLHFALQRGIVLKVRNWLQDNYIMIMVLILMKKMMMLRPKPKLKKLAIRVFKAS